MNESHAPLILENPAGKGIVVFIHGFMGSPRQFDKLVKIVYQEGYSAAALLLPGHGGSAKDFSSGSYIRWQNHANSEIEGFSSNYENIWLVGHSMGCLLAINAAVKYSRYVRGIFLIACPFKITLFSLYAAKVRFRQIFRHSDDSMKAAYIDSCSVSPSPSLIWRILRPAAELWKLIRVARISVTEVQMPVIAAYSTADELVSFKSLDILKTGLHVAPFKQVVLSESLHTYFPDYEWSVIERNLIDMITV